MFPMVAAALIATTNWTLVAPDFSTAQQAAADWSKNTGLTVRVAADCSGVGCMKAVWVDQTQCSGGITIPAGCAIRQPDGSARLEISRSVIRYGTKTVNATLQHEMGHPILGYSFHLQNMPRCIMNSPMDPANPPRGLCSYERRLVKSMLN